MDKNQVISEKPPTEAEKTDLIMVKVTPYEKELFETLSSILSKLDIDGKGTKVIKNNSLSDFVRMSLSVVSNFDNIVVNVSKNSFSYGVTLTMISSVISASVCGLSDMT